MTGKICAAAALLTGLWAGSAQAALVISTAATSNVSCSGGVCTATAANAVLNAHDLMVTLAHGDTTLVSGSMAQDIEFDTPVHWASAHRLTLDSYHAITFTQPVMSEGPGGMTITTNDGGTGGDFIFTGKGRVAFWNLSSSLIINGASYTLFGSIATLVSDLKSNSYANYALANNYDASADGTYGAAPLEGLASKLEGLGNTISNFQIFYTAHESASLGLISQLDPAGSVSHLKMTHATIHSKWGSVRSGVLLGTNYGGTVYSDSVQGHLYGGGTAVGGLIGVQQFGTVANSSATVTIHVNGGDPLIGGLVGSTGGGNIVGSHAAGNLSASNTQNGYIGGLTAALSEGSITDSYATGTFSKANAIGGLVGVTNNGTTIATSYADTTIGGSLGDPVMEYAGGLVGFGFGAISNSYAGGQITYATYEGGLVGGGSWSVTNSYAFTHLALSNGKDGGVAGQTFGTFGNTYWDLDTSGIGNPSQGAGNSANYPGITGLTDAQLKSGLPAGFDSSIWGENPSINSGLPYLLALVP